jgi:xanthine/uracil permease
MIPAAVASIVVAIIAAIILIAKPWQKWGEAPSVDDWIRPLSISLAVLGLLITLLIFRLSPEIIRQTLTCSVYVLTPLCIAALVTILVLLWRRHRHSQIAD